jgi:hypothetical protein
LLAKAAGNWSWREKNTGGEKEKTSMELTNQKGSFLARLFLINLPVITLLVSGILAIFLIIHTWLPVIIGGLWVIAGWAITVILRLTFVRIVLDADKIRILFYPVRIMRGNYKKFEIHRNLYDGAQIDRKMSGLIRNLVLYEKSSQGRATYPPVNLSLFSKKDQEKLVELFNPALSSKDLFKMNGTAGILVLVIGMTISIPLSSFAQQSRRLSVSSIEETLHDGKVLKSSSDLYFDLTTGKIVAINRIPEEFIYISDPEGRAQIYYPAKNQVLTNQNLVFSSRNNNLWFFLNNQGYDLGLQGMGFKVMNVRQEESFTITTWQAPLRYLKDVDKIDLVHENHVPIYLEYRNTKGVITQKIYYSDFLRAGDASIPTRVTEILFKSRTDSTIRRSTYTNILYGEKADTRGFDFRIPPNAKPLMK